MWRTTALLVFIAAPMAMVGPARAEPVDDVRGSVGLATYVDQMDTTIVSPHASVGALVPWNIELEFDWGADVITSASVDVVTAATTRIEETRNELGVGLRREGIAKNTDVTAGYAYSFENDGHSHVARLGLARGFGQDNWQLAARYSLSMNRIGARDTARSSWKSMKAHGADVTLTRLLDRRTLAAVNYSFYYLSGFQASLYRRVPVLVANDLRGAMWLPEQVPETRLRHAITLRARRTLGARAVGSAEYRLYFDDWGVAAHMIQLREAVEVTAGVALRFSQRFSVQGATDFYEPIYRESTRLRTRDRRLSGHVNGSAGATLLWTVGRLGSFGTVEVFARANALAWRYDDFYAPQLSITGAAALQPLGWVKGVVGQLGVEVRP